MRSRSGIALALLGVAVGGAAAWTGNPLIRDAAWLGVVALVSVPLAIDVVRSIRRRSLGVDAIALVAMIASVAAGELLAASVLAIMVSGGEALEAYAGARARKDLSALLAGVPRIAHRREGGDIVQVDAADVRPGDRLVVKHGEMVPVDGSAASTALVDESTLTGEPVPVDRVAGDPLRSGAVNAGVPFDMVATATADQSTYAGIVRLAREAEAMKAPFVRMADRYAGFFLPATLVAAGAAWALSGDARRAVAVLVVATPCPMILAAPVAFVSGISSAARRGILFKGGPAIEALAGARVLLMDKTGTLTTGVARVTRVVPRGDHAPDEVLRLAASLDQMSSHVFAPAIVREARARDLPLSMPVDVTETPGLGVRGKVDGRHVAVGKGSWVADGGMDEPQGSTKAYVAIEGRLAGEFVLEDRLRPDAARTIEDLRRHGIRRVIVVTGDHPDVADAVGSSVGADEVLAERTAGEKAEIVRRERIHGSTVMVGDGVNDAPALAEADVGVALGARGSAASSESAGVVLLVDRLDSLVTAIEVAKRSMAIARQSVLAGMGLSIGAMGFAAFGLLPPLAGALFQEGIDVAVILNALRALAGGHRG